MQVGLSQCMSKRWIEFTDKKAGLLQRKVPDAADEVKVTLSLIAAGQTNQIDPAVLDGLKKRKLITSR